MATDISARTDGRHPWLDAFAADPSVEFDDLLSGHARIEPFERADAPDAARLLFGGLPAEDDALDVLDRTMSGWLDSRRRDGVPDIEQLPLERWIRKVAEAFEIIAVLKLPRCSSDLRRRYMLWNSWADRLAVSPQRDGRYSLLRTLALTQQTVAEVEPGVNPFALEPLWLRICGQAGGAFPPHYLEVGLLGLRMLPEREGAPSERPWMTGFVHWAIGRKPPVEEFSQQWWALKGSYPRMPPYWKKALAETLGRSSAKQIPRYIKDWWLRDVKSKDAAARPQRERQPVDIPRLSPLSGVNELVDKARDPLPRIKRRIETLIDERRRYAEVTGDSYFLVATACNIGMEIIKGADDPAGRGQFAVGLAHQALAWQPTNVYAWALWRDALAKQGAFEAAELVGWESIGRFPEDVQWRTQLALLLADLPDRRADAENLLRETMERFPDDVVVRNQLALLLADLPDRRADAENLLRETMERFPDDVVVRNQLAELLITLDRIDEATGIVDEIFSRHLENEASFGLRARLLYHSGDRDAAREVLEIGLERFPNGSVLRIYHKILDEGKSLRVEAESFRSLEIASVAPSAAIGNTDDLVGAPVRLRGRLRRLRSEYGRHQGDNEWRNRAFGKVRQVFSEDPNLAYVNYLSRELEMESGNGEGAAGGSFAIAFTDALKHKDGDKFARLEKSFSGQAPLIYVAKTFLFADVPAAERVRAWLADDTRSEPRTVAALRGFLGQRFKFSTITSADEFVKLVAHNDNIQADLIESALAGDELLLVA